MTVDAAGDLWVAIYGGGRVNRYAPDGSLRDVYPIPARECTCCAFGGPGLHRLFVTTATEGWTDEQRRSDLDAGLVYRVDTDATGGRRRSARIRCGGKASPGERADRRTGGWDHLGEFGRQGMPGHLPEREPAG